MNTMKANTKQRRLTRLAQTAGLVCLLLAVALSLTGGVSLAKPLAATAPGLGSASSFSVLAALSMSAAGAGTTVSGDLGLSPGLASSKTGPWTVGGSQYFGPSSLAANAQTAALGAFNNMAGQPSTGTWGPAVLNPVPGVWTTASDVTFAGTLTLHGGPTDVWVFQIGRDMTFSGSVNLTGGARACNVFWQISRSATIASGSAFVGTLIASADITLVSGADVDGRMISLNSSLTTDGNRIHGPTCAGGGPGGCSSDGWPLVGEGFVNNTPTNGLLLRFNLTGWDYDYWQSATVNNGWTNENRLTNSTLISGATWVPNAAFSDANYVLDRVTVDGGAWNIQGGPCANLVVRVYLISKTSAVATAVAAGTPAAPILIPATGADLAGEQAFVYRQWMFGSLGLLGVCLALMGFMLGHKPRG